jgi:transposase
MSIDPSAPEAARTALFGDLPSSAARAEGGVAGRGAPRIQVAQRDQLELQVCDLDALLAPDHAARIVWAFVEALDLGPLYGAIRAIEGHAGRPAIDPKILVALWLYATVDGVGSARELDRLCTRDAPYRWLAGGVGLNHHTLAEFRTAHGAWLDRELTRSLAALMDRGLVTLEIVAQDGMRVRASAKAASFRRRARLEELLATARAQVEALRTELGAEPDASTRRKQAARARHARERAARLAEALATLDEIAGVQAPTQAAAAPGAGDGTPPSDAGTPPAAGEARPDTTKPDASKPERRVSTTDPEARVMKMADGGFRPAFNAQLVVDADTQLIAAVDVVNSGSDMNQMAPMHEALRARYMQTPAHWLADGGYANLAAIDQLAQAGSQPCVPVPKSRNPAIDPHQPKASDPPAVAAWRIRMASQAARALYKRRGASVECANAQFRRRGFVQLTVRGLVKARAVVLWHALAHNLLRMASLGFLRPA